MAISMKDLRTRRADDPPRILIYGPPKIGKTSLAAEFPAPVFIQTEEGTPGGLELESWQADSFDIVIEALAALYTEPHEFKTVVIDSLSALERLVWAETGKRGDDKGSSKTRIEDFGYGKGYVYALNVWQEVLDGLNALRRDFSMNVVLIGHSKVDRFDDPDTVSYSRYKVDLHDKASEMMNREMDAIFCIKTDVTIQEEDLGFKKTRSRAAGGLSRWIYCNGRASHVAGNRYDMPDKLLYKKGEGYASLAPFFPSPQAKPKAKKAA